MKAMKKMLAVLVSVMMALGMMTTAFAADTYSVELTGDNRTGHTYDVYQLFVGELTMKDGKETLANIKYGSAFGNDADTAVEDTLLDTLTTEAAARAYAQGLSLDEMATYGVLNSTNSWKLTGVPTGYYLIVDKTDLTDMEGDVLSRYIIQVVGNTSLAPKADKPSSDKVIYNDAVTEDVLNDAGVGTVVSYKVSGTIAADADYYDYYNFIMNDTLSDGLTFNNDIVVTIDGAVAVEGEDYALYTAPNADGKTFQIALLDAKSHAGKEVVATYSATLNSDAVAMDPENNTFSVTYSNNPEHKYVPDNFPPNDEEPNPHPGKPLDDKDSPLGETPETVTKTYTTKLVLTKTDNEQKLLPGATFKLTSTNANQTVLTSGTYYELDNKNGTYYLLKDGTYTTTAPTDAEYVATGSKGDSNTTAGYILVDGEYVVPTDKTAYIDQDLYILKLGTASEYANTNKYSKVTKAATDENASEAAPVEIIATTDANGNITFDQLGTGEYVLTEVDAPDGYNYADEIKFTIVFDAANETFTVTPANGDVTSTNGILATTVVDNKGTVLPETGGMGTTLFYAVGGLMVVVAGVLLITKKRMNG